MRLQPLLRSGPEVPCRDSGLGFRVQGIIGVLLTHWVILRNCNIGWVFRV